MILTAALFSSGGPSFAEGSTGSALIVRTDKGAVRGAVADGVENFLDIPYAAPPVGALRWRPPQPVSAWRGVRPAMHYGRFCTQPQNFDSPSGPALDEDCLYLNVQRPTGSRSGERLPVYVYIHGGGYVTGSGMKDTQEKIVRSSGVVGVSFNYRLGALGFLALPALAGTDGETGDFGLLDQQAALRWVRRNIAAFGGDSDKVTIGGESAGGWSVCTHLVAPGSRGLFSKAVIESGSCISHSLAQAETAGRAFAARMGCPDDAHVAECLRAKSVTEILSGQDHLYVPTNGTPFLPVDTRDAILVGHFVHVPVLIGSTRDEARSFTKKAIGWSRSEYEQCVHMTFGSTADAVLKLYPYPADNSDPAAVAYQVAAIGTDNGTVGATDVEHGIGGCGDLAITEALARNVPVYAYEFSSRTGPGWFSTPGYHWGAGHAAELTYLYPRHDDGRTYSSFNAAERRLSDEMTRYWGAFVTSAAPDVSGQKSWPPYKPTRTFLSLDVDGKTAPLSTATFARQHHCGFWDGLAGAEVGPLPN